MGEALIYGNPVGCNFISYGHCVVIVGALTVMFLMFKGPRRGFVKRNNQRSSASNKTLPGTNGYGPGSLGTFGSGSTSRGGVSRVFSLPTLLVTGLLSMFVLITALVIVGGYVVTCNELHYETKRKLYGKSTLGTPIRDLNIACYSLFRYTDFHARFHFDHYEYSGQWHGQYRVNNHGRVHKYETKHEHVIGVALALEMALGGAWVGSLLWFTLFFYMLYLRYLQKRRQNRELAESIEDARIYASSRENMDLNMGFGMKPMDQMSMSSHMSSSVLSGKPGTIMSTNPSGSVNSYPMLAATPQPNGQIPVIQQQYTQQLQNGQQQLQQQQPQTQYVQLANGMLVPMSTLQTPHPPQNVISTSPNHPYAQLMPMPTPQQAAANQHPMSHQQQQPTSNQMPQYHPAPGETANHTPSHLPLTANQMPAPSSLPQQPVPLIDPFLEHFVDTATLPPKQISHQPSMTSLQAAQQIPGNQESIMPAHSQGGAGPFISQLPGGGLSGSRPPSRNSGRQIKSAIKYHQGGGQLENDNNSEDDFEIPNNHLAQRKQVDHSSDLGMKCSQI